MTTRPGLNKRPLPLGTPLACRVDLARLQREGERVSPRRGGRLTHLSGCIAGALCSVSVASVLGPGPVPGPPPLQPTQLWEQLPHSRPENAGSALRMNNPAFDSSNNNRQPNSSPEWISRAHLENRTQCIRGKRNKSSFIQRGQRVPKIQISFKSRSVKSAAF